VIGWASATGKIGFEPPIRFLIIFLWTPPNSHFWDPSPNEATNMPGPVSPCRRVVAGKGATPRQILVFSVLLVPISLLSRALGFVGTIYVAIAVISGAILVVLAFGLHRNSDTDHRDASHLFVFSILYLFLLFAPLLADHRGDRSVDSRLVSRRETRWMVTFIRRLAYTPY
jgi:heme o synthase